MPHLRNSDQNMRHASEKRNSRGPVVQQQKKERLSRLPKKTHGIVLECERILLIEYLDKVRTITGQYFSDHFDELDARIREERASLNMGNIVFHKNNAPTYKDAVALRKLQQLEYDLLDLLILPFVPKLEEMCI